MTAELTRVLEIEPDPAFSVRAGGLLAPFTRAGVLTTTDVQTAAALLRIEQPYRTALTHADELTRLAAAFCIRSLRHGSVATTMSRLADTESTTEDGDPVDGLPWPDALEWAAALAAHSAVATDPADTGRPLMWDGTRLYLRRYWDQESAILEQMVRRAAAIATDLPDGELARATLTRLFPDDPPDLQRLAAAAVLSGRLTIIAGGPGTGKTTTIARVLAALREVLGDAQTVALAAPTGKAAARLQEATNDGLAHVREATGLGAFEVRATTLHRLLGAGPDPARPFRHDRFNPLPHDVVIVDECSMVDVTMMGRLVDAVRQDARLILVGDPDQLASVDAGAVLGDLVSVVGQIPPARAEVLGRLTPDPVEQVRGIGAVTLTHGYRFDGAIGALARAIAAGDADEVLARLDASSVPDSDIEFICADGLPTSDQLAGLRHDVVGSSASILDAATRGDVDAALDCLNRHRVLCAHRDGPFGVSRWNNQIRAWLGRGAAPDGEWAVGQGVIITTNDYLQGLYNGDAGVIVADRDGSPMAAFARPGKPLVIAPSRLEAAMSLEAMTIHRGQGSQFQSVSVILPPIGSPLLSRELLYTAVTRAQHRVRVIGSRDAVAAAVQRRVVRASGLGERLRLFIGGPPDERRGNG